MKKNFRFMVMVVAIGVILGGVNAVPGQLGGYKPAAKDNEEVVAAAEFAVDEQSKKGTTYKLVSVERAERQSVAGTNFRMCLKVGYHKEDDDVDATEFVEVVVNRNLQQEFSLISWAQEDCGDNSETGRN